MNIVDISDICILFHVQTCVW